MELSELDKLLQTTTTETTKYGITGEGAGTGAGLLMGVGGTGDSAIDVTYSTKVDGITVGLDLGTLGTGQTTTTTTTTT